MKATSLRYLLPLLSLVAGGTAQAQSVHTFAEPNFGGQESVFRDPTPNLQDTRPTQIESARIIAGRWLFCAGTNYTGDCVWITRDISSLAKFGFTATPGSLRPERVPLMMRNWGGRRPAPRNELAVFEKPGFDGNWQALKDSTPDFIAAKILSPGSIVLGGGVWRVCTGPDYAGRCLITTGSVYDLSKIFPGRILSAKRLE